MEQMENEKLKKENEEMKANALLVYNPEWSGFEGKKLEAWTEYVTEYGWLKKYKLGKRNLRNNMRKKRVMQRRRKKIN